MSKSEMQFNDACEKDVKREEVPIGLALSLAMNERAMDRFSSMSKNEKQSVIEESRQVKSKQDMEQFVDRIGGGMQG